MQYNCEINVDKIKVLDCIKQHNRCRVIDDTFSKHQTVE